ncbi:MAG TPA: Gldg family protein [Planctomycetota bacterium]|nr:Gldg family protein [Planctomycetota bacterium]
MRGRKLWTLVLTTTLVAANVVLLNLLLDRVHGARLDLSEDRIYTLAPETIELLTEPEEPIELFFYFTAVDKLHEKLRPVAGLMQDKMKEIAAASGGKVAARLVEWDRADKATQDRALNEFGVKPLAIPMQTAEESTVRNTYFALVVAYGDRFERYEGGQLWRVVPLGQDVSVELENVEYLVAKSVNKVVRGFHSVGAALAGANLDAKLEFYFSPVADLPEHLKKAPDHARKVADKLKGDAGGRLTAEFFDPTGDGPEKEALRRGLADEGVPSLVLDPTQPSFYSWAKLSVGKRREWITLVTYAEELTESDMRDAVEGTLKQMVPGFLTVVGLAAPGADEDPMARMMGRQQPPQEFGALREKLAAEYEVKDVKLDGKPIPREVTVLVVVRPDAVTERAAYEIDQFVMRGGRLVVCADAYRLDMQEFMQSESLALKSVRMGALRDVLRHWGADVEDGYVLDARSYEFDIPHAVMSGGRRTVEYVKSKLAYMPSIDREAFDRKHPVVAGLNRFFLSAPAPTSIAQALPASGDVPARPGVPAGVEAATLFSSSPQSTVSTDASEMSLPYTAPPTARARSLAVALRGRFPSWFADKPTPPPPGRSPTETRPADGSTLKQSRETTVTVIGDSDFLSIMMSLFQLPTAEQRANLALLRNAIDFGGEERRLAAIRGREVARRPLSELTAKSPEERTEAQSRARTWALVGPGIALLGFGLAWWTFRRAQPAYVRPTREATS